MILVLIIWRFRNDIDKRLGNDYKVNGTMAGARIFHLSFTYFCQMLIQYSHAKPDERLIFAREKRC